MLDTLSLTDFQEAEPLQLKLTLTVSLSIQKSCKPNSHEILDQGIYKIGLVISRQIISHAPCYVSNPSYFP